MPPPWIAIDVIPELGRPAAIDKAVNEAAQLRDRARVASEQVAAAQEALHEAEQADVEQAAQRARSGQTLGTPPATVAKLRSKLELATREQAALQLAAHRAASDLIETIRKHADEWQTRLDEATEQASERGRAALAALEQATADLATSRSAAFWLEGALADGRFDRPMRPVAQGSSAPSSVRRTANSEALHVDEVLAYARELVDPPLVQARAGMLSTSEQQLAG